MKDVQFMTAAEKETVLKQWEWFLKSGLKAEKFTERLYHHLIQHCSFIAHYDRGGFFGTYFDDGDGITLFLSQFDGRGSTYSVEYGGNWWKHGDYEDINSAMIEAAAKYIPGLIAAAQDQQKQSDLRHAAALLARHGMTIK